MFYDTHAQQFAAFVASMVTLSERNLVEMTSAKKIIEMKGPMIVGQDDGVEEAPGGYAAADCMYILYQFKDGSLIWYVRTPGRHYVQLRGFYDGKWKHSEYVSYGEQVMEKNDAKAPMSEIYPAVWNNDITSLDLPMRALTCLRGECINLVGELINRTVSEIQKIQGVGPGTLKEIVAAVERSGLKFDTYTGDWQAN